jgi:penicillin amidase
MTLSVIDIYAATNKDAMALGYVHAQDRLWQMELMRRIVRTTFGDFRKVALKNDKFFSGLGIEVASAKAIALEKK